jgi:hypothetical protein
VHKGGTTSFYLTFSEFQKVLLTRARIYVYVRQPLAGDPQSQYTTTHQRRLTPALEVGLVVYRPNLVYLSVNKPWQTRQMRATACILVAALAASPISVGAASVGHGNFGAETSFEEAMARRYGRGEADETAVHDRGRRSSAVR